MVRPNPVQQNAKLAEEMRPQVRGPNLDVLRLHGDRLLQRALAPRVFRVVMSCLDEVKALDELYMLSLLK